MKKWEKVLLLITAIPTGGFSISVIICCKCLAFQLVMGYKAQGLCACAFTICIQRTNPFTFIL